MADRKIKQWITVNGVHVPIFEGESKSDAVKRAISKTKDTVKANEDQKAKDIAKNKAEKDKLNGKYIAKVGDSKIYKDGNNYVSEVNGKKVSSDDLDRLVYTLKQNKSDNAESGKAVDNERVRLKGISDTINVIDKDKLNYTYDKDKNEYIISKKDYDKMYNDAKNKKYIENLQVGKGGNIIQTHGYHNAPSGKAVDEVRGKKEVIGDVGLSSKYDDYENHRIYKITKDDYVVYKGGEKGTLVHERTLRDAKKAVDLISKSKGSLTVPKDFIKSHPNFSPAELKKAYEEYLKKNRKK